MKKDLNKIGGAVWVSGHQDCRSDSSEKGPGWGLHYASQTWTLNALWTLQDCLGKRQLHVSCKECWTFRANSLTQCVCCSTGESVPGVPELLLDLQCTWISACLSDCHETWLKALITSKLTYRMQKWPPLSFSHIIFALALGLKQMLFSFAFNLRPVNTEHLICTVMCSGGLLGKKLPSWCFVSTSCLRCLEAIDKTNHILCASLSFCEAFFRQYSTINVLFFVIFLPFDSEL